MHLEGLLAWPGGVAGPPWHWWLQASQACVPHNEYMCALVDDRPGAFVGGRAVWLLQALNTAGGFNIRSLSTAWRGWVGGWGPSAGADGVVHSNAVRDVCALMRRCGGCADRAMCAGLRAISCVRNPLLKPSN